MVKTYPIPNKDKNHGKIFTFSKKEIIRKAILNHTKGNLKEAYKYYEEFINYGFSDSKIFCNFGIVCEQLKEFEKAKILYSKAIVNDPKCAEAFNNLGDLFLNIGELEKGYNLIKKAPPIGTLKRLNPFDFGSNSSTAILAPINFELS